MTRPTPRADLIKAVKAAKSIVEEGIEVNWDGLPDRYETTTLRAAALPVILRELLDVEVSPP